MNIYRALHKQSFSLLYFRCHALAREPFENSELRFLDNRNGYLDVTNIRNLRLYGGPLVVVNGCKSGKATEVSAGRSASFAKFFLEANASTFMGSLWDTAINGAEGFIEHVLAVSCAGKTVGEAVLRARQHYYSTDNSLWALFALYGQPDSKIVSSQEPT